MHSESYAAELRAFHVSGIFGNIVLYFGFSKLRSIHIYSSLKLEPKHPLFIFSTQASHVLCSLPEYSEHSVTLDCIFLNSGCTLSSSNLIGIKTLSIERMPGMQFGPFVRSAMTADSLQGIKSTKVIFEMI